MRQEVTAALAFEVEEAPREFGTGLRSRLELVRARREQPILETLARRDISPELMLVSPDTDRPENVLAELLAGRARETRKEPLGTLLSEAGLLDPAEVQFALARAREEGKRLGQVLVEYGLVTSTDIVRLVAQQRGLPFFDVGGIPVDLAAVRLLPADHAHSLRTLPIGFVRGMPVVALADPSDEHAMRDTRSLLRAAEFVASPEDSILAQLARVYF